MQVRGLRGAAAPLCVLITDQTQVGEAELLRRLDRFGSLSLAGRPRLVVQLRDPQLSGRELLGLGSRLRRRTLEVGAELWVNDRLDLARLLGADGVHLGRRSLPVREARAFLAREGRELCVSVSAHNPEELRRAVEEGADVALVSPIFASPGKPSPLGLDALGEARVWLDARGSRLELVALGGVEASTLQACLEAGAQGGAAIRADLLQAFA